MRAIGEIAVRLMCASLANYLFKKFWLAYEGRGRGGGDEAGGREIGGGGEGFLGPWGLGGEGVGVKVVALANKAVLS